MGKYFAKSALLLAIVALSTSAKAAFDPSNNAYQNLNSQPFFNCVRYSQLSFFSKSTMSERFQKLYDGSIEKELFNAFKDRNNLAITSSLLKPKLNTGCFETNNIEFLDGISNSERLQKIYDGSLEREYLKLNP